MQTITEINNLSSEEFFGHYVKNSIPVRMNRLLADTKAVKEWNVNYFKNLDLSQEVRLKDGDVAAGRTKHIDFMEYLDSVLAYEENLASGVKGVMPSYLHDYPMFQMIPELYKDVDTFPAQYFPSMYTQGWQDYAQFFMGCTGSSTPLHFDTLCTHNLFFQIHGSKKFTLIPGEQSKYCYMRNWRWSSVDAETPDYGEFPLFRKVDKVDVILNPGDVLFIPSGMLHQVKNLSYSISFNIDWHTKATAVKGLASILQGAPWSNFKYNLVLSMGLFANLPKRMMMPFYRSYLSYIS